MTAEKMMEYLWGLPEQFKQAINFDINLPERYQSKYSNILISGLGGSAIGGDILRTYALGAAQLPVLVNRDYDIPAFVNRNSLFLVVSYSGNTEETLSAYSQAMERGASIIAITGGGKLAQMAKEDGNAVIQVPGGLVPRAATAYLFVPLALVMEELGIMQGVKEELEETVQVLEELRKEINPEVGIAENQAKELAHKMKDRIPLIWGSSSRSEIAAMRWKTQINENSKCPAFYNILPELNHNEIVGFELPEEILKQVVVVILQDGNDNERIKKRMEISKQIIKDKIADVVEVKARGQSFLARIYSLIYIGDYASYYLALEYGLNPTPVKIIDYLKGELAKAPC